MAIEETIVKSGISGGLAALSTAYPAFSPLFSVLQPVAEDFASRALSTKERDRVDRTYEEIIDKIGKKLEAGSVPRTDDYWAPNAEGVSNATVLLEGVLIKARDEYEEKKRRYFPNFCANMCFAEHLPYERLNTILRLFEQLTYRQLLILAYVSRNKEINIEGWESNVRLVTETDKYYDVYCEVLNLYNSNLLRNPQQGWSSKGVSSLNLSPLGKDLVILAELDNMPEPEISEVASYINAINSILASHK